MRIIPSRDQYYYDGQGFKLKNPLLKRFRLGLLLGLAICFMVFSDPNDSARAVIMERLNTKQSVPSKQIALIEFISKYNQDDATEIVKSAFKWADHFDLDPLLLLAIAYTESHFDRTAISSVGAMGIMQILTKWHIDKIVEAKKTIGDPSPFNVNTNMFLGAWVFKDCAKKHKTLESQLHCYNGATSKESTYDDKVLSNLLTLKKV